MKAEDYKKLAKKKEVVTEDVPLPSGAIFKMRPAPLQAWIAVGLLPASMAAMMDKAATAGGKQAEQIAKEAIKQFTIEDFEKTTSMGRKLLEYSCVEPRVCVDGTDPDALGVEDIDPDDLSFLMKWVWSGGKAATVAANFRKGRQSASMASSNRPKLRETAE